MIRAAAVPFLAVLALGACAEQKVQEKADPLARNVIDEAGLSGLLLTAGSPNEAAGYFAEALAAEPERADFRRGLAISLDRAKRYPEAARVYRELEDLDQASPTDRLSYAFVALKLERWDEVMRLDASLPPDLNTARRHLLSALIADHQGDWEQADAAYSRAETLTTVPARILNNWGVSHQARGDLPGAERLFLRALSYDSRMFSAKNNLAMTRALQGNYALPVVPMTEREEAQLLYNIGLIALQQRRVPLAKGLFAKAVETHPQYYEQAADRLAALEAGIGG